MIVGAKWLKHNVVLLLVNIFFIDPDFSNNSIFCVHVFCSYSGETYDRVTVNHSNADVCYISVFSPI